MRQIAIRIGGDEEEKRRRRRRRVILAAAVLAALVIVALPRAPEKTTKTDTTASTTSTTETTATTNTTSTGTSTTTTTTETTTTTIAPAHLAPLPPRLTFAAALGGASAPQIVRIRNDGDAPLAAPSVVARGDAFRLSHDCLQSLAKNESCSAAIVFAPAVAGTQVGQLAVNDATVALSGVARPSPPLDLGIVDFGSAPADTKRPPRPLRFANGRAIAIALGKTIVEGPFAAVADRCGGARLPPGGACDVMLTLATGDAGTFNGRVQLRDARNDVAAFATIMAETTPVRTVEPPPAKIVIAPRQLLFTQRVRGQQPIVLTNRGGRATTIAVDVSTTFGFIVDAKACHGRTMIPGDTCTIIVIALPVAYEKGSSMRIRVTYDGHAEDAAVVAK